MIFDSLTQQQPDTLLALIAAFRDDARQDKIDVGVGVYRDGTGRTPVFAAVKQAEARMLETQESKSYLGAEGDQRFSELTRQLVFGLAPPSGHHVAVQTPGGTGALRLGAELLVRAGARRIWVGEPTWPNHDAIFAAAGLEVRRQPFFDRARQAIDFDAMIAHLASARPHDVLLLHGCCHNPTGTNLSYEQWATLAGLCKKRGIVPFVDLAYHGLGDGLDADVAGTRLIATAVPATLVAYSCDKNFGLYRDRTGSLLVQVDGAAAARTVTGNLLALARSLWSMPPDHGAAVVRLILDDPALSGMWRDELDEMRIRIAELRGRLAEAHPGLVAFSRQSGLFSLLPIEIPAVDALRTRHAIYLAPGGRINVAGLTIETIPRFVAHLTPFLNAAADGGWQ